VEHILESFLRAVGRLLFAALGRQFSDEIKAWIPRVCQALVETAVRRLPQEHQQRYTEEWSGHLEEVPGAVSKLIVALGFVLASHRMDVSAGAVVPYRIVKRFFDLSMSTMLLALYQPLFALIAMSIVILDGGPIFERTIMYGVRGRPFTMYRFMTIRGGRITRFGELLKRYSLDELPQIYNVFRGDMSLVGPQTMSVQLNRDAPAVLREITSAKPGITGLSQIRECKDVESWIRSEREYIKHRSIIGDLKILWQTVLRGLRSKS
jgi:sugar transferase EpsL